MVFKNGSFLWIPVLCYILPYISSLNCLPFHDIKTFIAYLAFLLFFNWKADTNHLVYHNLKPNVLLSSFSLRISSQSSQYFILSLSNFICYLMCMLLSQNSLLKIFVQIFLLSMRIYYSTSLPECVIGNPNPGCICSYISVIPVIDIYTVHVF